MEKRKGMRAALLLAITALMIMLYSSLVFAATKTVSLGTLKKDKTVTKVVEANKETYIYFQFKVSKPGYVLATGNRINEYGVYGMNAVLCNSKKKVIDYRSSNYLSAADENDPDFEVWAVTKGTYYIRVQGKTTDTYVLSAGYGAVANKGAAKKAKAVSMKAKKAYTGVIGAGSGKSTAEWFKIKTNGKKNVKLTLENEGGQGTIKLTVTGPHMNSSDYLASGEKNSYELYSLRNGKKVPLFAGTYYVKISKYYSKTNSCFNVKWQYK